MEQGRRVEAHRFACGADAAAARADDAGRGQGRRGRRPRPWRDHAVAYRVVADTRRIRRTRRGRPAKTDPPPVEPCDRLVGAVTALPDVEADNGWTVLATTRGLEMGSDAEILQAYHEQHTTVEPGFRWSKKPAAMSPVWLEQPERMAALAMRMVLGWFVYAVIQRQVRLSLRTHDQPLPGNKGETATPTAAVVLALFAPVAMVHRQIDTAEVAQVYGLQAYHLRVCDALGLDHAWYEAPLTHKTVTQAHTP